MGPAGEPGKAEGGTHGWQHWRKLTAKKETHRVWKGKAGAGQPCTEAQGLGGQRSVCRGLAQSKGLSGAAPRDPDTQGP